MTRRFTTHAVILALAAFIATCGIPNQAFADGAGSTPACDTPYNDAVAPFGWSAPGGYTITGVCIKAGTLHTGVLASGVYLNCYTVVITAGTGNSVSVTRTGAAGPNCQEISHIDVIKVQDPPTATPTRTSTATATLTATSTSTRTPTWTPTATSTLPPTATSTFTPTSTVTASPTGAPSHTPTSTPTLTSTPSPSVTPFPTWTPQIPPPPSILVREIIRERQTSSTNTVIQQVPAPQVAGVIILPPRTGTAGLIE